MEMKKNLNLETTQPETLRRFAPCPNRAHNKRVPGYGALHLRPNPRYARTSDTRQSLSKEKYAKMYNKSLHLTLRRAQSR